MYKLTLGSINEIKYSKTDAHGLFSGTIETDRVVLVDGDGKYLQVDGNWGTELKNGLVRTWSATRDSAEIEYQIATTNATTTAAVYVYDGVMALQSTYADVDAFIDYLVSEGVKSAIIDLGGNLVCIGNKNNMPYTIGIQRPFADRSETIATMKISDKSVVSSGIYERYFIVDDVLYHHILNPKTGYPYTSDLLSVTIVADYSVDADALSTSAFALGLKDGLIFMEEYPGADAVFITKDGNLHFTEGFEKKYQVK
jgi:hypothetical protein